MRRKGFEVVVKDAKGETIIDRPVNDIREGEGWARHYTESPTNGAEATFFVDGEPRVTYHGDRKNK